MIYNDIYTNAIALLGEDASSAGLNDYKKRAPILISNIVSRLTPISDIISASSAGSDDTANSSTTCSLDSVFPLDKRLAVPCAYFLASLLILDQSLELSARLDELGQCQLDSICAPCTDVHPILEVYP